MSLLRTIFQHALLLALFAGVSFAQDDFHHPELDWFTITTEHFFVHYHSEAERTAKVVAKIAEDVYEPITSIYNHKPDSKVSFIIKDYDDYSNGAAYFYDNKVEIWATSMDFDLRGTHNWLRNVITHEFTHIIQIQTSMKFGRRVPGIYIQWLGYEAERRPDVLYGYPNVVVSYPLSGFVVPAWFAEGVAQHNRPELAYDAWDAHRDMILRMYALDGKLLSWNEMAIFGKTSLGNESSYNAGFAFVRYIAEKYGEDKISEISRNLSTLTEVDIDGAMRRALGKRGKAVYGEWVEALRTDYTARTANVRGHLAAGDIIADVGFANFYPTFSPGDSLLAYVSNKEADYFSLSSLYLYNVRTKTEEKLQAGVRSNLSWTPDGKRIYYSKITRDNPHWSGCHDIYFYDLEKDEETRVTRGIRANAPAVSPDGEHIAYVAGSDGTLNLFVMDIDGSNSRKLTTFSQGEQVYNPKWSPDGRRIVFDYSMKDGRDVAMVLADGGEMQMVIATPDDERNAVFSRDGTSMIFASDRTGIFNLFSYEFSTGETVQLTNVLGGAFMPSIGPEGALAFASYTSTGYKIAVLSKATLVANPAEDSTWADVNYQRTSSPGSERRFGQALASTETGVSTFNWKKLRNYDDTHLPEDSSRQYRNIFTSLSLVPFLRIDNYNPKNRGIDVIKPGLYVFSNDVLDKYGLFAGAAINRNLERDLFFIFDYRDRVPGLFHLGLEPTISLELYNITRKTEAQATLGKDTIGLDVTYSLLEFDAVWRQKVITEVLDLEMRFAHSRYTSTLEFPILPSVSQIIRIDDLYFIGNDFSLTWTFNGITPSRTQEIRPVGRRVKLRYDYEFNKFNPDNRYDAQGLPLYERFKFHRLELNWRQHVRLPGWKHTLSAHLRGGSILGPAVDDFFDFYVAGLAGMRGYPYYALGGNEMASLNVTYRFPIIESIDVRFLHLHFDKLYGAIFGDVGDAWTGTPKGNRFKRDAGVELRLESFSWYAYPTRIFLAAAYGFDRFERPTSFNDTVVAYGKEWRIYLGVLFGFELD
jgi:Tol biopolymer transport system component